MRRFLLLGLVSFAAPLAAQTPVPLAEALDRAKMTAIGVLRADAQVESARISAASIDDGRWPSLSLSAGGGQRYGLSFDQTSGDLTQSTVESLDLGLRASYVVFDGYERRAQSLSAQADLRAAELTRERAAQETGVAVLDGYLAIAQAEAARAVATENVTAERDLLAEITVQVEYGARPSYEQLQQEERVATAQLGVLRADRDRTLAHARLVRLLDLDPTADYTFPTPEARPPGVQPGLASGATPLAPAAELVRRALGAREDLRAATASVRASEADARAARASRLPEIALNAYVGTSFSSAGGTVLTSQVGDNRAGSLRLGIALPIFDQGRSRQRIRQAEAQASALRAYHADARRAIALEVEEIRIQYDALSEQIGLVALRVRAAEAALSAEEARYAAGESTLQSVSLLRARTLEARTEQAQLGVEVRFQRLLLALAIGEDAAE